MKISVWILFFLLFTTSCTRILFRETLVHSKNGQPILIRGSQPDAKAIRDLSNKYKIRTIVNLRGESDKSWYLEEEKAAEELGIKIVNIDMNSKKPLQQDQLHTFLSTVSNQKNWPVFTHCQGGAHRTGAMVGLYRKQFHHWNNQEIIDEIRDYSFNVGWERRQKLLKDVQNFVPLPQYQLPFSKNSKEDFSFLKTNTLLQEIQEIYKKFDNSHRNIPLQIKAEFLEKDIQKNHLKPNQTICNISIFNKKESAISEPIEIGITSLYLAAQAFRYRIHKKQQIIEQITNTLHAISQYSNHKLTLRQYGNLAFSYGVIYSLIWQELPLQIQKAIRQHCSKLAHFFLQEKNFTKENQKTYSNHFLVQQKLAFLLVAAKITESPMLIQVYRSFAIQNYYTLQSISSPFSSNSEQDMMSFLCFYNMIQLESGQYSYKQNLLFFPQNTKTLNLKNIYKKALNKAMYYQSHKKNPLLHFIYYSCNFSGFNKQTSLKSATNTLKQLPLDRYLFHFSTKKKTEHYIVPLDERPPSPFYWKQQPYISSGLKKQRLPKKYSGVDFLLAYWMGRYHQFIWENM